MLRCSGCKGCRQLLLPCEAMVVFLGGSGRLYAWWWLLGRRAMSSLGQKRSKNAAGISKGAAASSRLLPMTCGGCYQEPLPLVVSGDSSGGGCCGGSSAIQQTGAITKSSSNQARENFAPWCCSRVVASSDHPGGCRWELLPLMVSGDLSGGG